MLAKRIIPCLDIKDGRTVKGIQFENLRDAGDPVELGKWYSENGADELVFLDITATNERRKTLAEMVTRIASEINIPFTVGGGISSVEDVYFLLNAGADKISVNSAALKNRGLINTIAKEFGSQCLVLAIDAKQINKTTSHDTTEQAIWKVYLNGGRLATDIDLFDWAKEGAERGAGEILFTSMDNDGEKKGYANHALARMSKAIPIPVIASGGAGCMEDFYDTFTDGYSDAALAASIFHFKEIGIWELKKYLKGRGIEVRC